MSNQPEPALLNPLRRIMQRDDFDPTRHSVTFEVHYDAIAQWYQVSIRVADMDTQGEGDIHVSRTAHDFNTAVDEAYRVFYKVFDAIG